MAIYSIYRFTNLVNGKVYIGKTKNANTRKLSHIKAAKSGSKTAFHCALIKYGIENFAFDVIFNTFNEDDLNYYETRFIQEYHSHVDGPNSRGYNMTTGGDGVDSASARRRYYELLDAGKNGLAKVSTSEAAYQRIKEGKNPWAGERGSKMNQQRIANGTHNFTSEEANIQRSIRAKMAVEAGTHPFAGSLGSEMSKQTQARLLASGHHHSQVVSQCPHCGKVGKGNGMKTFHFDRCKHK